MNAKIDVITESYRKTSNGCIPIVLRLTKDRKRKIIRLGININPDHWDATKNKIKPSCPDYEYLENIITDRKSKFQKQVLEFQSVGKDYSLTQLANAVDKPTKNTTVTEYLNKVIQDLKTEDRIGNACHYESLLNSLHRFTKASQLLFVDIDTSFLNRYESHLRGQGNRGNTISNRMRTLRAVYNRAIKDNIVKVDYYPFTDYNVSKLKETTPKRSISKDDILRIINFDVTTISNRPQSLMQFSKDLFIFSYFGCGINMADIAYLKKSNVIDNRVVYQRQKTSKRVSFVLQPMAESIANEYMTASSDYIFPILDDAVHKTQEQQIRRIKKVTYVANKNLKKIGQTIGLPIPLTTYVSRHSFATILKRSGVNIAIISEALGHSDLKTTQIYLDSFENSQIDEAMKNLL